MHNTASDAIFSTIVTARHIQLKKDGCYADLPEPRRSGAKPHPGDMLAKYVAYTSVEAHSCVEKNCRLALISLRILAAERLNGDLLEKAIQCDKKKNLIPIFCCATLGTPNTCEFDDIESIGKVCKRHSIYFTVDAAYAGNAMICPNTDWLRKGLNYADSIVINPCKMMMVNIDLSCLYVSDTLEYQKPYYIEATYLFDEFENAKDPELKRNEIDYRHYGIALSRRMRALKLWFMFRLHGLKGIRDHVMRLRKNGAELAKLIMADNRFEVVNTVKMGLVVFRQKP